MDKKDEYNRNGVTPNPQEKWNMIVEANNKAAVEVLGHRKHKQYNSPDIIHLSVKQKQLHHQMNSTTNKEKRSEKKELAPSGY
jgi:hypothetical protein